MANLTTTQTKKRDSYHKNKHVEERYRDQKPTYTGATLNSDLETYGGIEGLFNEFLFNSQGDKAMYANLRLIVDVSEWSDKKFEAKIRVKLYDVWEEFDEEWRQAGFENEEQFVEEYMVDALKGIQYKL